MKKSLVISYHENGGVSLSEPLLGEQRHGLVIGFNERGELTFEAFYEHGQRKFLKIFLAGKLIQIMLFDNNDEMAYSFKSK